MEKLLKIDGWNFGLADLSTGWHGGRPGFDPQNRRRAFLCLPRFQQTALITLKTTFQDKHRSPLQVRSKTQQVLPG